MFFLFNQGLMISLGCSGSIKLPYLIMILSFNYYLILARNSPTTVKFLGVYIFLENTVAMSSPPGIIKSLVMPLYYLTGSIYDPSIILADMNSLLVEFITRPVV